MSCFNNTGPVSHMTWLSVRRPSAGLSRRRSSWRKREEEQEPAWVHTIAVIWHHLCHSSSGVTPLTGSHSWKWSPLGEGSRMQRKVGGAGSEITSCFSWTFPWQGLGHFELFFKGLSQPNLQPVGSAAALSHPASDPLRLAQRCQEEDRERDWEKRERQGYSLSTLTHSNEPGREKNASTQLTALFHTSSAFIAPPTELPPSFTILELLISIADRTTCLWPRGRRCFLFGGNVLTGAGPEDPRLSGADRLASFQV